jgi:hypothetical protein
MVASVSTSWLDILEMSWITESSPPERRVGLRIMAHDQAELARPGAGGSIVTFGCEHRELSVDHC